MASYAPQVLPQAETKPKTFTASFANETGLPLTHSGSKFAYSARYFSGFACRSLPNRQTPSLSTILFAIKTP
jgi:hypothetical protein